MNSGKNVSIQQLKTVCSTCSLRELCLPMGLAPEEIDQLDNLVYTRRKIKRGDSLYRAGDPFGSLNAVRTGFFKSTVIHEDGRDQVTGFHMPGEIMGLDGIGTDRHAVSTIALEDSEVCVIPYSRLEEASLKVRSLQYQFHKMMSREIVRDQGVMMLLGTMRAEERLAAFLLNLSQRFGARGYSATEFNLRMTREEIGSYLGLKLETISRIFSKFQDQGLITVQQKHVRILDTKGLRKLLGREC
ncbi:MAG TPA: fumarate/nitrate reduction transcriptional regulator Fnr [Burkholderiales bacterium]|nr:fumarate/nitrate reduction transcriptional regulator Fnr [Burkholderiales bacterium]